MSCELFKHQHTVEHMHPRPQGTPPHRLADPAWGDDGRQQRGGAGPQQQQQASDLGQEAVQEALPRGGGEAEEGGQEQAEVGHHLLRREHRAGRARPRGPGGGSSRVQPWACGSCGHPQPHTV